jgi:hypothetical protein
MYTQNYNNFNCSHYIFQLCIDKNRYENLNRRKIDLYKLIDYSKSVVQTTFFSHLVQITAMNKSTFCI